MSIRVRPTLAIVAFFGTIGLAVLFLAQANRGYGRPHSGPEVPVTGTNQLIAPANNSPTVAADPTQARFVVLASRLDAPDFGCALQVSGDGGRKWVGADPVPKLPLGVDKCYAPEAAFDRRGKLYYLFVGLAGAGNEPTGAFLTTSTDRARTFTPPRRLLGPLNFSVRMAIEPSAGKSGRMQLVWLKATSDPPTGGFGPPPNPIMTAYSDDGGRTLSEPVQVSDPERQRVVAPSLALGEDGRVHIAYFDLKDDIRDYQGLDGPVWDGTWSLVVASSTDGGQRFRRGVVVTDAITPPERVMLIFTMPPAALAADKARICASWTDARRGDPDVMLSCSPSAGAKWSLARRLNDDKAGNGRWQYLSKLSLSNGRIDAIFYDRRDDPKNVANNVYYTYSAEGGANFSQNLRITTDPSDSRIGQEYGNASALGKFEFGSRLGLLSSSKGAMAAWTDTRNSRPGTPGQDIFAAFVSLQR